MDSKRVHASGGLIFNSSGNFLILESAKVKEKWVLPGGKLEPEETAIDALRREVFEETNLRIKDVVLLGNRKYTSPKGNPYFFFDYSAKVLDENQILINKESCAYQWINKEQMNEYQFSNSIQNFFTVYLKLYEKLL